MCLSLLGAAHAQVKETTKFDIKIEAAAGVNPDEKGQAKPIKVRIYELKTAEAFNTADYFALDTTDKTLLGADLLAKDEFILKPLETKTIVRTSNPETAFIGVLAGYLDLSQSVWRVVHKLPPAPAAAWYRAMLPANKAKLVIKLQAGGILLVEED